MLFKNVIKRQKNHLILKGTDKAENTFSMWSCMIIIKQGKYIFVPFPMKDIGKAEEM